LGNLHMSGAACCGFSRWLAAAALAALAMPVAAIEDRADTDPSDPIKAGQRIAWKATIARYRDTGAGLSADVNLRGNTETMTFWLGDYRAPDGTGQLRAGLETSVQMGGWGKATGSVQAASGGFLGWSITWDARRDARSGWAPLLGIGRTNTRPYVNLNFDPNDSVMVGVTYAMPSKGMLTAYQISDDRLGTGQRVSHLVWRMPLDNNRLTLDAFRRSGAAQAGAPQFHGHGLSATLDVGPRFIRLGWDGRANYTGADVARVSVGQRF
jgi:hypothetical protein